MRCRASKSGNFHWATCSTHVALLAVALCACAVVSARELALDTSPIAVKPETEDAKPGEQNPRNPQEAPQAASNRTSFVIAPIRVLRTET